MKKQEIKLMKDCIKKWGENAQIDILIEEMAELTKALLKTRRHYNGGTWLSVMDEYVDVTITIQMLKIILENKHVTTEMIESKIKDKLKYLEVLYEKCCN